MTKYIAWVILGVMCSFAAFSQERDPIVQLKQHWKTVSADAKEDMKTFFKEYENNRKLWGGITPLLSKQRFGVWNDCYFISVTGEYILNHQGKVMFPDGFLEKIPEIDIDNPDVCAFLEVERPDRLLDSYFTLRALREGATFDEARDGMAFSTNFSGRALNHYDLRKLNKIFSSQNGILHDLCMNRIKFVFRNSGYFDGAMELLPLIKKNVRESDLKKEILERYERCEKLRVGNPVPQSLLADVDGKIYHFSDFKGKVVVADIWATWCCSCIEKMPHFMKLRDAYQGREDVIFLTISIDRRDLRDKWLKVLNQHKMSGMLNLIASGEESAFSTDFATESVPRCFVIDKKGKIVSVYAPGAGDELKQMVESELKK